ncbi:MAG TPA: ABC transporter permease [Microbacteriaceae bacterium]|mgnify:CR=1 FL=1|nr:ABC transporter permease [Microbacteriaceae bacterium]
MRETPRRADLGVSAPAAIVIPAALCLAVLILPLVALLTRASWSTFWVDITAPVALNALGLSLATASVATLLCTVLGLPLALLIVRARPRTAALLRTLVAVPLVLPPMVGGVALLYLVGRSSPFGAFLFERWHITIPFTPLAVVFAQVFVAMPFLVLAVEGALRTSGQGFAQTAATLGAGRWRVLWRITLPLAVPGIIAGVVLCFARALGEFGATALFAGNAPGVTQTMPLAIYSAFNGGVDGREPAVAMSLLLLVAAVLVLMLLRAWRPGVLR